MNNYIKIIFSLFFLILSAVPAVAHQKGPFLQDSLKQIVQQDSLYPLFFTQKPKNHLVEAVGFVEGKTLGAVPLTGIGNALSGKVPGLATFQENGEPGNDQPFFLLRGRTPLVLVDGIPRNIYAILPEQVESITVLKDALSAAALGLRGADGVIMITTRKQAAQPGHNMDFSVNTGIAQPLKLREQLSSAAYAELYNEALINDGRPPLYTMDDIAKYRDGSAPYTHPDNDWYGQIMEKQAPYQRYVLSADGKTNAMGYFLSIDYLKQGGLLTQSALNSYSTNVDYRRFGFRGNVSIDLSPRTILSLNIHGSSRRRNAPGGAASLSFAPNTGRLDISTGSISGLFNSMLNTPANAYPVFNPDGSFGGNQLFSNNIRGQSTGSGYSQINMNDGLADLLLERDMGDVWKGWWVKATASYTMEIIHNLIRNKNFATYEMKVTGAHDTTYRQFGSIGEQANASDVSVRNGSLFIDLSTGVSKSWDSHHLDVAVQYQRSSARYGSQLPFVIKNGILRAQYRMSDRYIFDMVTSYSGNNWYKPGHQYQLYPSAGIGWNVHNESFFPREGFLDRLKLRTNYGLTGRIDANYFSYLYTYSNYGSAYYIGTGAGGVQGTAESQLPYVRTTEKALKWNLGVDLSMLNERFTLSADYYRNRFFDLLQQRGSNSAMLGAPYPAENLGKSLYTGLEATAHWADGGNNFNYFIAANIAVQRGRITHNDQPAQAYPWMETAGNRIGQLYGYIADGFVTTAGEGPVVEGYRSAPGDLKYRDLNGDGVINFYDVTRIGPDDPEIYYGINAGFTWEGFDLSLQLAGLANRTISLTGTGEWEFQNEGRGPAFPHHYGRWTAETASNATYPRLTAGFNPNNHVNSSFWLSSADFLRLKTVALGYTFRGGMLDRWKIKGCRVFASGYNLLTFSGQDRFDPESRSMGYPLQRILNGGISIKF
ncbi:SusC/RagA family TonB-linked outer membrane protein [Chitinophaga sp. XS-30]|uniref:SusC/RagA family TonB-linked outer membrane protein n=1 Tax=Chitinophaga sp. XS-30 TaxID=2604421 RepID=UPI0011DDC221|nr:SusC/RagA family TonB-linked outer membrane protein [Chitinophaga sp. XS-30]QEH43426.1 SusC/RagA family TonB-linked outer membrane protein [Chitinophaga sp. XS-30]